MDQLEPPQASSFDGNHTQTLFYLPATEKDIKGDKIQTSIFLTCIVQKEREIYETFTFEPGDEMKLAPVLHKFSKYCYLGKPFYTPSFSHTGSKKVKVFMIL